MQRFKRPVMVATWKSRALFWPGLIAAVIGSYLVITNGSKPVSPWIIVMMIGGLAAWGLSGQWKRWKMPT